METCCPLTRRTAPVSPRNAHPTTRALGILGLLAFVACAPETEVVEEGPSWLAGDHHIHSRYSVGWDREADPPEPIVAGDAIYPIPMNAVMGRYHGLDWMVSTDHGGPNHSKVNLDMAYPELQVSREAVPDLVQFYGMEFDSPGADHASLIIPRTADEAGDLFEIESRFAREEPWPPDSTWDSESRMVEALTHMRALDNPPVLIANHPSRSAPDVGQYGLYHPAEFRRWNDTAPDVAVGMAGAPGHQALTLAPDGTVSRNRPRGGYGRFPTMGGFDQMTARVGGFWDSMLGEGRRWWITANSDSHVHWRDGGADFWPGEYSKTYVLAEKSHESILGSIRAGRVFVTTGDLISELWVTAESGSASAGIGGALDVDAGADVRITIRVLDPSGENHRGEAPGLVRVDLIAGDITGPVADPSTDGNPTTRVVRRFEEGDWERAGAYWQMGYTLEGLSVSTYVRVRGTNSSELEPQPDARGEDPWSDLWFYSNPIFLEIPGGGAPAAGDG